MDSSPAISPVLHVALYFCRMNRLFILLTCLSFLHVQASGQTTAKPFPGTRYVIQLPDSFLPAERFVGFQNKSGDVSVMTSDVPSGIGRSLHSLDSGKVSAQGTIVSREVVNAADGQRYLYSIRQQFKQKPYFKYMLLVGDSSSTRIFSAFVPEKDTLMSRYMVEALRTLSYDSTVITDPWDALSFTMNLEQEDLKFVLNNAGGIIFSRDGKYPARTDDHTTLVAGLSIKGFSPHSRLEIAKNRLMSMKLADSLQVEKTDSVVIDGLQGYELIAYGLNKMKEKELVYMVMLFETDQRYYLMNFYTNRNFDKNLAMFRKTVHTFKRKR